MTFGHAFVYSSTDGTLKAIIECDLLGQIRTGAASGLATKLLANPDADTLGVIGTGRQSRSQVRAVCAVRPIKRVMVFARTKEHRETYAREMEQELGIEVRPAPTAEACVSEAGVVVTITKSAEPVCRAEWLAKGAHINVAGANSADRREVDVDTVLRATVKATDQIDQAKVEAGEFRDLVVAGKLAWSDIHELGDIVAGKAKGRTSSSDLTLFKSLGIALEDMAFGELIYQKALARGRGTSLSPTGDVAGTVQPGGLALSASRRILRAGSEPSSRRSARRLNFQPSGVRTSSHLFAAMRCTRKPFDAAVVRHLDRLALRLRHQDLQIGDDGRGVAVDLDERQPGEVRKPARDRGLVAGAHDLLGQRLPPARAGQSFAAVERTVLHPAGGDVVLAAGIGARRMAGDQVVDFQPVFDRADALFEGAVWC